MKLVLLIYGISFFLLGEKLKSLLVSMLNVRIKEAKPFRKKLFSPPCFDSNAKAKSLSRHFFQMYGKSRSNLGFFLKKNNINQAKKSLFLDRGKHLQRFPDFFLMYFFCDKFLAKEKCIKPSIFSLVFAFVVCCLPCKF